VAARRDAPCARLYIVRVRKTCNWYRWL